MTKNVKFNSQRWHTNEVKREKTALESGWNSSAGVGDIVEEQPYPEGTFATHDGKAYISKVDVPAGRGFVLDDWDEFQPEAILELPQHDDREPYVANEMVRRENRIYFAIDDIPANTPWDSNLFNPLTVYEAMRYRVRRWDQTVGTYAGEIFRFNTTLYLSINETAVGDEWNENRFIELNSEDSLVFIHSNSRTYKRGQLCYNTFGDVCAAVAALPAGPFRQSDWNIIASATAYVDIYRSHRPYRANALIITADHVLMTNPDPVSGAWDETEWVNVKADLTSYEAVIAWTQNTDVLKGQIVTSVDGSAYYAFEDYTTGLTFRTDSLIPLTAQAMVHNWERKAYRKDTLVIVDESFRRAKSDLIEKDYDPDEWDAVGISEVRISDFVPDLGYGKDAVIYHGTEILRALDDIAAAATINTSEWQVISARSTWRGIMTTTTAYRANDVVLRDGVVCIIAANIADNNTNLYRSEVVPTGSSIPVYDGVRPVAAGYLTRIGNRIYVATVNVPANTPFDISNHNQVAWDGNGKQWAAGNHLEGDLVLRGGHAYLALTNTNQTPVESSNHWLRVSGGRNKGVWVDGDEYQTDDIVHHNGKLLVSLIPLNTSPISGDDWAVISFSNLRDYAEDAFYNAGEVILVNGVFSRARAKIASAPAVPNMAQWEPIESVNGISTYVLAESHASGQIRVRENKIIQANSNIAANTAYVEGTEDDEWTVILDAAESGTLPLAGVDYAPASNNAQSAIDGVTYGNLAGLSPGEALVRALFPPTAPNQSLPEVSTILSFPLIGYVGEAFNGNAQANYEQNDGGATDRMLTLNLAGVASLGLSPYVLSGSYQPTAQFAGFIIDYQAGTAPTDSNGDPRPDLAITAGSATDTVEIRGIWKTQFTAAVATTWDFSSAAAARTTLDTFASELPNAVTEFTNVTIPAGQVFYIAVPGSFDNITVIRSGFEIPTGSKVGEYTANDYGAGTFTTGFTLFSVTGEVAESLVDTITIS